MKLKLPKRPYTLRTKIFIVVGLFIVPYAVLVIGQFSYKTIVQLREFKKAESSLNEIQQKIRNNVGAPEETEQEQYCYYESRTFGKGPRNCRVTLNVVFGVENEKEATVLANNMNELISPSSKIYEDTAGEVSSIKYTPLELLERRSYQTYQTNFYENREVLICLSSYRFSKSEIPYPTLSAIKISESKPSTLYASFSCTGSANFEYYPAED